MKRKPLFLSLVVLAAFSSASAGGSDNYPLSGRARALDGDTVSMDFRLYGIDAPEYAQRCRNARGECIACGKMAQDLLSSQLKRPNAIITLQPRPGTSYGRPIVIASVNGRDVAEMLLLAGYAIPRLQYLATDPARKARYFALFAKARAAHVGIHATAYDDPADYRDGRMVVCKARYQQPR